MRILVDMDGILVDLLQDWLSVYNSLYKDTVTKSDVTTWGLHNHVKCGENIYEIIERDGFVRALPPIPGAIEGFHALKAAGHEVFVATAAPSAIGAAEKIRWCKEMLGIERRDVIVTHQKHLLDADVIIDDRPKTLEKWSKKGKMAVTIAYPYNLAAAKFCALRADGYNNTERAWREIVLFMNALNGGEHQS